MWTQCLPVDAVALSLRATTRNPVSAWHGIPDVETPDLIRGRDDKQPVRDDNFLSGMTNPGLLAP